MIPETPNIGCVFLPSLADLVVFFFVISSPSHTKVERGVDDDDSSPSQTESWWGLDLAWFWRDILLTDCLVAILATNSLGDMISASSNKAAAIEVCDRNYCQDVTICSANNIAIVRAFSLMLSWLCMMPKRPPTLLGSLRRISPFISLSLSTKIRWSLNLFRLFSLANWNRMRFERWRLVSLPN